jgi:hypothetical protein
MFDPREQQNNGARAPAASAAPRQQPTGSVVDDDIPF